METNQIVNSVINRSSTSFFIYSIEVEQYSGYRSGGTRFLEFTTRSDLGTAVVGSKESNNRNGQQNGTSGKREHGTVHSESCIYIPSTR